MKRTTVMLPEDLKARAVRRAHKKGMSFGELLRTSLEEKLRNKEDATALDPLFADQEVFHGKAPRTLSKDHDRFLYESE